MPISKLIKGHGAAGALRYLKDGKRDSLEPDRAEAWRGTPPGCPLERWPVQLARQAAKGDVRLNDPYVHIVLSFDPNDPAQNRAAMPDEKLLDFGGDFLRNFYNVDEGGHPIDGDTLADRLSVMAVHRDKEHPHVHIIACRVNDEGNAFNLWHDGLRRMAALRATERQYSLRPPKERNKARTAEAW